MALLCLAAGVACAPADAFAAGGRVAPARVTTADAQHVAFRIDVPGPVLTPSRALAGAERIELAGYERLGDAGAPPTLSRRFLVGLPPEGTYSFSYRVLGTQSLGEHRLEPVPQTVMIPGDEMGPLPSERVVWDEEVFQDYRTPPVVEADEAAFIRRQRVLPLRVNPVVYDPASRELSVATTIEVVVRFAAPRPDGGGPAAPPRDAKGWDEIFGRLLVNAAQSRSWRDAGTRTPTTTLPAASRVEPGAVKIRVRETGLHTTTASALVAAGFPPGQPVANLHLFRRNYDEATLTPGVQEIACDVVEDPAGSAGVFDGNDRFIFYGRRLRDDAAQGDTREQTSAWNVYWLEPAGGTRMTERVPAPGFVSADTATASFPVTAAHFETDLIFRDGTPLGIPDVYYYNFGTEAGPVDMPFEVNAVKPGTNLTLSAELHGQTYEAINTRTVRLSLANSKGDAVLDGAYPLTDKQRRTFSVDVAAADLDVGPNRFRLSRPANTTRNSVEAHLNFVEATYQSLYRARGGVLRFNSASLAGDTSITVTGLTSTSGFELFDVTDPLRPERVVLGPGHFRAVAGGFALSFRENFAGRREFALVATSRMIPVAAGDIVADTPSTIIGSQAENGVDVLVVSHRAFIPTMRQWVSYRRSQGYRAYMVDVEDVFDEFNGGVPSPRAVYRFARHFFERGDAGALVLVGDGSEDHKRIHDDSGPDYVPTFNRVDNVSVLQLDEVVTTDKRFVKFPGPGGGAPDIYPDMIIGRIPVGEVGELEAVLNKVYAYEAPTASDFWRKRMVIIADDAYSQGSSTFGGFPFCYNGEEGFRAGQDTTAAIIERSLPAGYDVVRFFLNDYTSTFYPPPVPSPACASQIAAIRYVRENVTERLIDELRQGATLVTIQSHMNRYTVTHERLLTTVSASVLGGTTGRDHLRTGNRNKPWIIFGMGCHFSEFAIHRELNATRVQENSPNGDAFAEQYLFQNEEGAVGTYGSSGFEYLGANVDYMNTLTRIWFYEAPYDTMVNQTQAEWQFGQLMFLVESRMARPGADGDPVERYHILGDPLLRIDAGPPAFDVTVNGRAVQSGDVLESGGEGDSLRIVAVVTDENAIRDFKLEIDGEDASKQLTIAHLVDANLPRARQYRVSFRHLVRPETYDIVLRAFQAPDTLAGTYHMVAEFVLKVESSITVAVNGRRVESGGAVPAQGSYRVDLTFPVFIPAADIAVFMDDDAISDATLSHPSAEDSLAWIVTFDRKLKAGKHHLRITAQAIEFHYVLVVSEQPGLTDLVNYPNPFRGAGTNFVYSNDSEILDGTIDIYTVSGKRIRRIDIPPNARFPGQNSIYWDGRDSGGGEIANGVYLYVVRVNQYGGSATQRGKMSKTE